MKKKLINWDAFARIKETSLSASEVELIEAAPILAKALNVREMNLYCFGSENVVYETEAGEYIHANYVMDKDGINFENIEELVLNEESEVKKSREIAASMVDALLEDKTQLAEQLFNDYISLPYFKRNATAMMEEKKWRTVPVRDSEGKPTGKYKKAKWETTPHHSEPASDTAKRVRSKKVNQRKISSSTKKMLAARRAKVKKTIGEWSNLIENVSRFIDYKNYGPALNESVISHDERGNVIKVRIPNSNVRNEAKLLSFDWKTSKTDVEILRSAAKKLTENMEFNKIVSDLKSHNALSDNDALQETLEDIVSKFPSVLYLTQTELSETVKRALEITNSKNYDDQTCDFMAEGILRVALSTYTGRIDKIASLAGKTIDENADKYEAFKDITNTFYPTLDESNELEMQVYVDLYEALRQVYHIASEDNMVEVKSEVAIYLNELADIIEQNSAVSLETAQEVLEWLQTFVETNLEGGEWTADSIHTTLNGDHPITKDKANKSYTPSKDFSGDWGDVAPASDGKTYKGGEADKMRNNSYGNLGGEDVYPSLNNPYVPQGGKFEIKGEKTVDDDSDQLAHIGGNDTWPALQNPYVPAAVKPAMKGE